MVGPGHHDHRFVYFEEWVEGGWVLCRWVQHFKLIFHNIFFFSAVGYGDMVPKTYLGRG